MHKKEKEKEGGSCDKAGRLVAEADAAMKEGKKLVKITGVMKVMKLHKVDHERAALAFKKAGSSYSKANVHDKAAHAYALCAEAQAKAGIHVAAAQHWEKAAKEAKAASQNDECIRNTEAAVEEYFKSGKAMDTMDTTDALLRAAKLVEDLDQGKAINLYRQVLKEHFKDEDNSADPVPVFNAAATCALKANMVDEAIELLQKQIKASELLVRTGDCDLCVLRVIALLLFKGDYVGAERTCQQRLKTNLNFIKPLEGKVAVALVDAFGQNDQQRVNELAMSTVFRNHDEVTKFVMQIKVASVDDEAPASVRSAFRDLVNPPRAAAVTAAAPPPPDKMLNSLPTVDYFCVAELAANPPANPLPSGATAGLRRTPKRTRARQPIPYSIEQK
eukprot:TRINITY_DN209_c0_g1_i3.p1 TRINITY_DN209_c0_g1~~TRINITY_DN209_c0_g1_i3.p1  ORF type:complete len:396 (-),score=114.24 TRINITY_DN209_c0_g1_i3:1433-2599(-)